jgi:hypothetical protein
LEGLFTIWVINYLTDLCTLYITALGPGGGVVQQINMSLYEACSFSNPTPKRHAHAIHASVFYTSSPQLGRRTQARQAPRASDISLPRIQAVHQLNTLLIHRKHNPPTQHQPRQPRHRAAPEHQHALLPREVHRAAPRVAVQALGLDALHARLHRVDRLRRVHRDEARQRADAERAERPELLARRRVRRRQLLEEVVRAEPHRGVGGLPEGGGQEALVEAAQAALAGDDGDGVEEAAHAGVGALAVVDSACVSLAHSGERGPGSTAWS